MSGLIENVTDPEAWRLAIDACDQLGKLGGLPVGNGDVVIAVHLFNSWVQVVPASVAFAAISACAPFVAGELPTEQQFKDDLATVPRDHFLVVVFTRVGITKFAMSSKPIVMSKGGQA